MNKFGRGRLARAVHSAAWQAACLAAAPAERLAVEAAAGSESTPTGTASSPRLHGARISREGIESRWAWAVGPARVEARSTLPAEVRKRRVVANRRPRANCTRRLARRRQRRMERWDRQSRSQRRRADERRSGGAERTVD